MLVYASTDLMWELKGKWRLKARGFQALLLLAIYMNFLLSYLHVWKSVTEPVSLKALGVNRLYNVA